MCATDDFAIVPRILPQALEFCDGSLLNLKSALVDVNPELHKNTIFDLDISEADETKQMLHQFLTLNSLMRGKLPKQIIDVIETHPILKRWSSHNDKEMVKEVMRQIAEITVNNSLSFECREVKKEGKFMRPVMKDFKSLNLSSRSDYDSDYIDGVDLSSPFEILMALCGRSRSFSGSKKNVAEPRHLESNLHPKMNSNDSKVIGNGIFPFSSLLNHSCCQNADRILVDNMLVVCVRYPIKAGDQIFINYG